MDTPKRTHHVKDMPWPNIRCACGWEATIPSPGLWGIRSGQDWLLDQYNAHLVDLRKK